MTKEPEPPTGHRLAVIETATGREVHAVPVAGRTPRAVGRIEAGMEINLDRGRYHIEERGLPRPEKLR
jgi:hypothetical protein